MDFELRQAKIKWEKEQKEKKDKARARLERERKAKEEAVQRQAAIEAVQRVRRLEESAAALAASQREQDDLEVGDGISFNIVLQPVFIQGKGDKIRLPSSSFEQLSSQSAFDKGPMLFEVSCVRPQSSTIIENVASIQINQEGEDGVSAELRSTHAGVLEFTAEEGHVELPLHVWSNAGFKDPAESITNLERRILQARVRYVRLPKGTYAKLQPEGRDFADVLNHKAVLETELRRHASLSQGDLLRVHHGGLEYGLRVLELRPQRAVSVLETDLEVDVVGPAEKGSISQSRLNPLTIGKVEAGTVEEGQHTYFRFDIDTQVEKAINAGTLDLIVHLDVDNKGGSNADADLYVSAHPLLFPSQHQHHWSSHDVGSKVICLTASPNSGILTRNVSAGGYSIGVYGFNGQTAFKLWVEAKATDGKGKEGQRLGALGGELGTSTSMPSSSVQSEDRFGLCDNCRQLIPAQTLMLHEAYCRRHNFACQHPGCGVVLRKGDMEKHAHCIKCGQGSTREELAKHMKVFHEPLKCECGMELEMEDMVKHRALSCPKRLVSCQFCGDMVQAGAAAADVRDKLKGLTQHESECGARTAECDICNRAIMLKQMDIHRAAAHGGGQTVYRPDTPKEFVQGLAYGALEPTRSETARQGVSATDQRATGKVQESVSSAANEVTVECPICQVKFHGADREHRLSMHLDDEHFTIQVPTAMDIDNSSPIPSQNTSHKTLTVSCPICGMAVHSERDLSMHIDIVH